jgi:hypothetical protein
VGDRLQPILDHQKGPARVDEEGLSFLPLRTYEKIQLPSLISSWNNQEAGCKNMSKRSNTHARKILSEPLSPVFLPHTRR